MKCCICGTLKNCAPYLNKVFENIEKIASLFDDYVIILYYDKSSDNTLQILKEYQIKNKKLIFYVNEKLPSTYRTINIARGRNFCLNYKKSYDDCEHRAFHLEAINKNNARIRISPENLFTPFKI